MNFTACARLAALAGALAMGAGTAAAFETVSGPATDPACMVPWTADTKFYQSPRKEGPYRIALANGYDANSWRDQMLRTAKAYAAKPEVAAKLKEFKLVSTGEDVEAQIAAVDGFIADGYDAIVLDAESPEAFRRVLRRAREAGVVVVAFDNTVQSEDAINVNVDQKGLGVIAADWLNTHLPNGGKLLEVRGVPGTSVDMDRHEGAKETLSASGKTWTVTEVTGKWDDAVAKQVTTEAIAKSGPFDGIISQAGDTGVVQALKEAGHPFVPFAGETENGFRKLCAEYANEGLKCSSAGTGPAQVAVAIKVALAALDGEVIPQSIKLPTSAVAYPDIREGVDFYANKADGFFVGNAFPSCGISLTAQEIMAQTKANQ